MINKNNVILTLLLLFLLIAAIVAAVALATTIILGYTGFQAFNNKSGLINFRGACDHQYFIDKYGDGRNNSLKVGFICAFGAFIASLIALVILISFNCGCSIAESDRH